MRGWALATALLASLALAGCRSPTQITVTVQTDVPCTGVNATSFTAGELGALESAPPTSESATCTGGHLGTIVLVPSGDEAAEVGFKVVTALGHETVEKCGSAAAANDTGCIVARRALRYLPHTPLEVIVDMTQSCEGVVCSATTTCVSGACVSASIPDPSECTGSGCGAGVLPPLDAGVDGAVDATVADGGAIDATLGEGGDGEPPEAATGEAGGSDGNAPRDAAVRDGSVLGCDMRGTQPGAPWPMDGYCAKHRSKSPFDGPHTMPKVKWTYVLPGTVYGAPVVAADGTIYAIGTGSSATFYAIHPDGGTRWSIVSDGGGASSTPGLGVDGTLYIGDIVPGSLWAIAPDGSVTSHQQVGAGNALRAGPTMGGDGRLYFTDEVNSVLAVVPPSNVVWTRTVSPTADESVPAIGDDGTVYVGADDQSAVALAPDGGGWRLPIYAGSDASALAGFNAGPPAVGLDGTIYFVFINSFFAATPAGVAKWRIDTAPGDEAEGLAIDDDGTVYATSNQSGPFVVGADGGISANAGLQACNPPVIDASGWVFVTCYSGVVYGFPPGLGGGGWMLAATNATAAQAWNTTVIGADGTLYVSVQRAVVDDAGVTHDAVIAVGP